MYNSDYPNGSSQSPQPRKRHRVRNVLLGILGAFVLLIVLLVALAPASTPKPAASPAATHSATAQPAKPAATQSPVAPQTLLSFTGHGSESTPAFNSTGDFTVSWIYSNNLDTSVPGYSSPDNFIAEMHTAGLPGDPYFNSVNDISGTGQGNQTVSGDDGGHYFTVRSNVNSTWTIKVVTAP